MGINKSELRELVGPNIISIDAKGYPSRNFGNAYELISGTISAIQDSVNIASSDVKEGFKTFINHTHDLLEGIAMYYDAKPKDLDKPHKDALKMVKKMVDEYIPKAKEKFPAAAQQLDELDKKLHEMPETKISQSTRIKQMLMSMFKFLK